jgi:hypothetical protein
MVVLEYSLKEMLVGFFPTKEKSNMVLEKVSFRIV